MQRDFKTANIQFIKLISLSKKCIDNGSDLIIWPESALPFYNLQNSATIKYISKTSRKTQTLLQNLIELISYKGFYIPLRGLGKLKYMK